MSKIRTADIRRELNESPSTARELAAVLNMTPRDVNVGLWVLQTTGQVRGTGAIPNQDAHGQRGQRYTLKLYQLTPRGRARLREKREVRRPTP